MRLVRSFVGRLRGAVVTQFVDKKQRIVAWLRQKKLKALACGEVAKSWYRLPWSLEGVAKRDEAHWYAFNQHRHQYRLRWLDRTLLYCGERSIHTCFAFAVALVGAYWLLLVLPDRWFVNNWTQWGESDRLGYFTALWSIQATLAALAFPIVIAFMAVFLQRRPAASAYLNL